MGLPLLLFAFMGLPLLLLGFMGLPLLLFAFMGLPLLLFAYAEDPFSRICVLEAICKKGHLIRKYMVTKNFLPFIVLSKSMPFTFVTRPTQLATRKL